MKNSSKFLLWLCLALGIEVFHLQLISHTPLQSTKRETLYSERNKQMNQQIAKGGVAAAITLVQPGASAGSGQSYPSNPNVNIYNGLTLLWTGAPSTMALPNTQNGITVSAYGATGPGFITSLTIAATAAAPTATGLTILTTSGGSTTSGNFDIIVNPQVTKGGGAVVIYADTATKTQTTLSAGTIAILSSSGSIIASAAIPGSGSQVITVGNYTVAGTFTAGSSSTGAAQLNLTANTSAASGNSFYIGVNTYQNGTIINTYTFDVVGVAPTAPTAPTLGATTTGTALLPVNTQALTSNATSEVINVYSNSAGTLPIANSPFAVPTPGSPVNVPLVSGTQYYLSIGMVGSGGTTNGPLLPVLFDVTGPVVVSAVIQPSGNSVVVNHTEYSQPLQSNGSLHTITGLTGGAVTLSSPVYGGTTITYATNRTIASSETGALMSAPAGAFKDSASPTNNLSPAITNLAVTNNSTQVASYPGPTGLTAAYMAGLGVTLNFTLPTGNVYTGINVYRLNGSSTNGVYQRLDPVPFDPLPLLGTYVDKLVGTIEGNLAGSNVFTYYVCGVIGNVESLPSSIAGPVTFAG